jgi:hypothetical protein
MVVYRLALGLNQVAGLVAFFRNPYMDETGAPTGNADGSNPDGRRGWLWLVVGADCPASTPLAVSRQSSWPVRAPRLSPATTWGRRHEK